MISFQCMCTRERCTKHPQLGVNLKPWGDRSKLKKRDVVEEVSERGKGRACWLLQIIARSIKYILSVMEATGGRSKGKTLI